MAGQASKGVASAPRTPKPVQAALTASDVLEGLAAAGGQSSLTQLVDRTGIPLGTVHRMLQALAQQGYVRQDPDTRLYALGPTLIRVGGMSGRLLGSWSRPILNALVEATGETATLSLLDGADIVYIAQVPSPHNLRMLTQLGRRIPAASTAAGKALLSLLDDEQVADLFARHPVEPLTRRTIVDPAQFVDELAVVREKGFAVEDGEHELGVRAFAMPVRGERPMAVAVSGPDTRLSTEGILAQVPTMQDVVARLEVEATRH
ncbi:IclR family transcriptional regulator [Microbacterium sp.]|uniref:IclR family transcriptional regulator n=1 Tax=Microbacterium sp. TaxID=51671 RepID=UPI003341E45C